MKITLEYNGVIHSKKNSKQIVRDATGRPRIVSNSRAKQMEKDMTEQFALQLAEKGLGDLAFKPQVERILEAKQKAETYEVDIKIWNPDRIRRDIDNQLTSILDGLVKAGALPDDCASILTKVSAEFAGIDRQYPRARIELTKKGGESE